MNDPELSIYLEEGIADILLPNNILFKDFDYLDNITLKKSQIPGLKATQFSTWVLLKNNLWNMTIEI